MHIFISLQKIETDCLREFSSGDDALSNREEKRIIFHTRKKYFISNYEKTGQGYIKLQRVIDVFTRRFTVFDSF